jgi:hypothetical protein
MSRALKKWLRLLALVLLLAVPLVFLLSRLAGDLVRDAVAFPLAYLGWVARVYLDSVPQALFWGALLLFGLALAITNLLVAIGPAGGDGRGSHPFVELGRVHPGRVRQLTSQIRFASRSPYFRRRLAQQLGRVLLQSIDYGDQYNPEEIERVLEALDAPMEVRSFLREGKHLVAPSRPRGLRAWLRRWLAANERLSAPLRQLERVVQFLEERVEVA